MSLVGRMVETCVFVAGERRPTGSGLVVEDNGVGVCKVDICYPHAAPWIVYERTDHLRVIEQEKPK